MLLGFKAQHRVTGKFYSVWAEDESDARARIAGFLKVPVNQIMRALPSQAMGPDAIRFDPARAERAAAASASEKLTGSAPLPWQFPVIHSGTPAVAHAGHPHAPISASHAASAHQADRTITSDYGSIARPAHTLQFEDREARHSDDKSKTTEESESPSTSSRLNHTLKVA